LSEDAWSDDKRENTVTDFEQDGSVLHRRISKFDETGRTISLENFYPRENILTSIKTDYLKNTRKDREFFIDGGNNKTVTVYNEAGKPVSIEKFEDENSGEPSEKI